MSTNVILGSYYAPDGAVFTTSLKAQDYFVELAKKDIASQNEEVRAEPSRVKGAGFRVQGSGCRVQGAG